jgi:hypothetical protein
MLDALCEHDDRRAASLESTEVRFKVDAARVTGNDLKPTLDYGTTEEPGVLQAARRRVSRSAHANAAIVDETQVPPPKENRGRRSQVPQSARELVVVARYDVDPILREIRGEVRCCIAPIIRKLREVPVERPPSTSGELAGSPRGDSRESRRGSEKKAMFAGHH